MINLKQAHKTIILQHDQSDCGVACLASIIQFHGGERNLEKLRKLSGTSRQGTTLLGLLQAAKLSGFNADGMEAESINNLSELNEPAILHVTIEERLQHYVIYYPSIRSNKSESAELFCIGDPAKGVVNMTSDELNTIWKSKALLVLKPNEQFQRIKEIKKIKRKWILDLVREDFPLLVISLLLGIVISALGLCGAIFSQKLIDDYLPSQNVQKLVVSLILVALLLLIRSGLTFLRGKFLVRQGYDFNNRIIKNFYSNILALPKHFFDTRKTGELIARMSDTRRIQSVIAVLVGSSLIELLLVLTSMAFVFVYSPLMGYIILMSLPAYLLVLSKFNQPLTSAQKSVMGSYALAESNFIDTMQGVGEIKLMRKENFFEQQNSAFYGKFQESIADLGKLNIRFELVSNFVGVFFIITMFGISAWLVMEKEILLGEMVALLAITGNIVPSVIRLIIANVQIREAKVVFDRMFEFTSAEKEENHKVNPSLVWNDIFPLELKAISFRFPGRKQTLIDVSLKANKGEIIALLGESGSGKSTTIQLIQKFYTPEHGLILANGHNLNEVSHQIWREQIGCVPQDVKIFNGSLIYNITLSDQIKDLECAISFCEEIGFGKFFNELPQGYLTLVGEEGINLSGGQKQLIAIARALLKRPKLLLLDEATASMDRNTEAFILQLLLKLKPDMAIIIVTHRIQTAKKADHIYILENGRITISGRPNELMASKNIFSESMEEFTF